MTTVSECFDKQIGMKYRRPRILVFARFAGPSNDRACYELTNFRQGTGRSLIGISEKWEARRRSTNTRRLCPENRTPWPSPVWTYRATGPWPSLVKT